MNTESISSTLEARRIWTIIGVFLLAVSLPYLWAILITPQGWSYAGLLYNPDDQNVHLAWARQARDGHFFFRDLFTHESLQDKPLFNNLLSWLMGTISRFTAIPLIWVYHALRLVFSATTLWCFWKLCTHLTAQPRVRILAVALVAFSGGAGWLHPFWKGRTFIDRADGPRMMPEAWTFPSALNHPLFVASLTLLALIYWQTLKAQQSGKMRHAVYAATGALLLGNIHTYDVLPLNVVLLLWALLSTRYAPQFLRLSENSRAWLAPLLVILGTLPPLLYQIVVFRGSEEFRIKALTKTEAPPVFDILLSYSPLLILGILGLWWMKKIQSSTESASATKRGALLMALWVIVTLCAIYTPVSFARKMIEGVHLPICFLAALGLHELLKKLGASTQKIAAIGAIAFLSISSFNFVLWCLHNAEDNNRSRAQVFMPPLYLPPGDTQALAYLNTSDGARDKAVLCLTYLGNYMPRETGRAVFLGHWAETLNYNSKLPQAARFYGIGPQQMTADEARDWLRENQIGIVFLGFYEQQAGGSLPLELEQIETFGDTKIYRMP